MTAVDCLAVLLIWTALSLAAGSLLAAAGDARNSHRDARKEES